MRWRPQSTPALRDGSAATAVVACTCCARAAGNAPPLPHPHTPTHTHTHTHARGGRDGPRDEARHARQALRALTHAHGQHRVVDEQEERVAALQLDAVEADGRHHHAARHAHTRTHTHMGVHRCSRAWARRLLAAPLHADGTSDALPARAPSDGVDGHLVAHLVGEVGERRVEPVGALAHKEVALQGDAGHIGSGAKGGHHHPPVRSVVWCVCVCVCVC
jgi:hypothetical protein